MLFESALRHPASFIAGSGNVNRIYLGALLELLLIIANIGTAVVIVPIIRRQFEELSIGYVTARIVESTFILVGILAMLGIATLEQEAAGAFQGLATIQEGLWELFLGLYCTFKGFRPSSPIFRADAREGSAAVPVLEQEAAGAFQGLATIPEGLWEQRG